MSAKRSGGELVQGTLDALRRLERDGFVTGKWAISENNRRARYYALTARGRRRLQQEHERWRTVVRAMSLVLES